MKKLLLSVLAAASMSMAANAAEAVVIDFSTGDVFTGVADTTVTVSDVAIKFETANAYIGGYNNSNYLMLKSGAIPGAVSFTLPQECGSFVIRTTSGCSENAGNKVTVYAGETEITTLAINKHDADFTVTPEAPVAEGTVVRIVAAGSKNSQILTLTCNPVSSEPTFKTDIESLSFATPLNGTQTKSVSFTVVNVTENIAVALDNKDFSTTKDSYTPEEAMAGIEIAYTGSEAGSTEGTATFTTSGITVNIPLTAISVAHEGTVASPLSVADVITMNSANSGPFWVRGIVLDKGCANAVDGVLQTGAAVNTNLVLEMDGALIPVALPAGDVRAALNIVDNPQNVGATILVNGTLEKYFGAPGVKNVKEYVIESIAGIGDITVDKSDAPVEYFNLQGIRIANPAAGSVVIRRQGTDIRKFIVR